MGVDLSKIQLPAEDANKPAELDNTSIDGDGENFSNVNENKNIELPPDDREGLTTKLGATEGEDRDLIEPITPEEKPTPDTTVDPEKKEEEKTAKPTDTTDTLPTEEKVEESTDFHKHPDWIKNQEKTRELELEKAKLEGKLEVMEKKGLITEEKKEEAKSAAQVAEDAVEARYKEGWKPKDALELNKVYSEEFEKALDAKADAKAQAAEEQKGVVEERRKEIQKEVDGVYTEFGITQEVEQNKVADLAMKWANDGTANWSINTLKLAADHLKAKGEIGKTVTPEPKMITKEDPAKQTKDDINKKISRPTSEGGATNTPVKKSIGEMRRKSLDDIVLESAGALG